MSEKRIVSVFYSEPGSILGNRIAVLLNDIEIEMLLNSLKKYQQYEYNTPKCSNECENLQKSKIEISKLGGCVYIVKVGEHFKIGKTKNIKSRMGEYTKLPIEPKVVFLKEVTNCSLAEETLHNYFKNKRVRGEWFNLDDEDIEKAKQLV